MNDKPSLAEYIASVEKDWASSWGWNDFDVESYRQALESLTPDERSMVVGKHCVGIHHLANVIKAADQHGLYMVSDTIRWLMWHEIVRDNRERFVQKDLEEQIRDLTQQNSDLRLKSKEVVEAYRNREFLRTADVHPEKCGCLRCAVDNLEGEIKK